jgi:hypothetical protein
MNLDLDGISVVSADNILLVPVMAIRKNIYPVKGKGLAIHDVLLE